MTSEAQDRRASKIQASQVPNRSTDRIKGDIRGTAIPGSSPGGSSWQSTARCPVLCAWGQPRLKGGVQHGIDPLTLAAQEKRNSPHALCLIFMATSLSAALQLFPTTLDSWGAAATAPLNIKPASWRAGARWLWLSSRKIPTGRDDAVTFHAPRALQQFHPHRPKGEHGAAGAGSAPRSPRCALNKAQPRAAPA